MTSLYKIGLILMAVTVLLVLVHPAEADDDVKRKRVIIKIPHRVKHIYHHHTKKVHVHKKKPKPKPKKKKPHKHVHVVVEEEEIVQPIKSWKSIHSPFKGGSSVWDDWKAAPSGFKHSVKHPDDFGYGESTHLEEEFAFEGDHDSRESRTRSRPHSYKGVGPSSASGGGPRGRKKAGRPSYRNHEDESSYETYHHHDQDQDFGGERPRSKPKSKMSGGTPPVPRPKGRGSQKGRPTYRTTRRPRYEEKYLEPDEYDELYDRGPAYPERKEHPSWHERSRNVDEQQEGPAEVGSEQSVWNLPRVPEVNEYIDDVNDTPDPGVTYINSGGFYPSSFKPITTITSSVVESNPPKVLLSGNGFPVNGRFHDFPGNPGFQGAPPNGGFHVGLGPPGSDPAAGRPDVGFDPAAGRPPVPHHADVQPQRPRPDNKKHKKNAGYVSKVSQTHEGLTVGYQSHIGHSSDARSPSSSFQSVSYGGVKSKK